MYWHKKLSSDWPLNKIGDETKCSEVFCKYTKKKNEVLSISEIGFDKLICDQKATY